MTPERKSRALSLTALTLGATSAVFPVLSLPALFVTALAALLLEGRARWLGGILGGLLACTGFVRFVVDWVAPNIVAAGRHSAEEKAVSRLREIQWAQGKALELGLVKDEHGVTRAATLDELATVPAPGGYPLLRADLFVAVRDDVRSVEGYLFEVHPAPGAGFDRSWVAYAWPAAEVGRGQRVFFIDAHDRICEARGSSYVGTHAPAAASALQAANFDAPACGTGTDALLWTPWKGKRARDER